MLVRFFKCFAFVFKRLAFVFYSLLEGISIGRSVTKLAFFVGTLLGLIKLPTKFAKILTLGADNCCYNGH